MSFFESTPTVEYLLDPSGPNFVQVQRLPVQRGVSPAVRGQCPQHLGRLPALLHGNRVICLLMFFGVGDFLARPQTRVFC